MKANDKAVNDSARDETNENEWGPEFDYLSAQEKRDIETFRAAESGAARRAMFEAQRLASRTAVGTPEHERAVVALHLRQLLAIGLGGESKRMLRKAARWVAADVERGKVVIA